MWLFKFHLILHVIEIAYYEKIHLDGQPLHDIHNPHFKGRLTL